MKKVFLHIFTVLIVSAVLFSSCSGRDEKVIPRKKMARIYAEMFMVDQWFNDNYTLRRLTDTTLIYEPILEKYGYTSEDYRYSVNRYLDDPERFSRILRTTTQILTRRGEELSKIRNEMTSLEERAKKTARFRIDFDAAVYFPYMYSEPYIHYYDSLAVEKDSLTDNYRIVNVDRSDTVYEGLVMVIKVDSTAFRDSIARADSLARVDSLFRVDSLKKLGKPLKKASDLKQVRTMDDMKFTNKK